VKFIYIIILSFIAPRVYLFAQEKASLSSRAPIEFLLLFEDAKRKDFPKLQSQIDSLNSAASRVNDLDLKRIIKHSIYLSLLKFKQTQKSNIPWKQFLEQSDQKEDIYFIQWLKKAIKKDINSVQNIQSIHDRRIKRAQFQKYLDPIIQLSLRSDLTWLHELRLQLLESLPSQLAPFQNLESEPGLEFLLKFEKPTPKRSELLNKLIDSL